MAAAFFARKTSNRQTSAALELKEHARTVINADDETVVSISERDCGDPDCGGVRTIVLILHPRRPAEAIKIDKPLQQITQTDLFDALAPLPHEAACLILHRNRNDHRRAVHRRWPGR